MAKIPTAVSKRIATALPKFKKVLQQADERDVNESDTVTIVTDILEEVFGFDKYSEITREYAIKGTYCDLAIKSDKKVEYLIEVKAIGAQLNDHHLKQAVGYAANEGIRWVVLTNGHDWQLYSVSLEEKIETTKLLEFDFYNLNHRKKEDIELLFLLCKRGVQKDLIDDYYQYRQSVNRYSIGAIMMTDPVINSIRKELRKIKEGLKVTNQEIQDIVKNEVLKRDLTESDAAKEAQKGINKMIKKRQRTAARKSPKVNVLKDSSD